MGLDHKQLTFLNNGATSGLRTSADMLSRNCLREAIAVSDSHRGDRPWRPIVRSNASVSCLFPADIGGLLPFVFSYSWQQLRPSVASGLPSQDAPAAVATRTETSRPKVKSLEVVILSTMLTDRAGVGEWGFSALVVADGHRLLFDTGARPETVLRNAHELKLNLADVSQVILSHHHGDHTGGLLTLRRELARQNPKALERAYVGDGIFLSRPGADGRETNETLVQKS